MELFTKSTANLVAAAKAAGVGRYVAVSMVGFDRLPQSGYLRAKVDGLVERGAPPYGRNSPWGPRTRSTCRRRYRPVTIQAGSHTLTATEPPPADLAEVFAKIDALRAH
jgi:hypothetical protein